MTQWIHLCAAKDAPAPGQLAEVHVNGLAICLANIAGTLSAVDNACPHRQGPLAEGWIEGNAVVCPWHSWAFDVSTGIADYPENERVAVYPVRSEGESILVQIAEAPAA